MKRTAASLCMGVSLLAARAVRAGPRQDVQAYAQTVAEGTGFIEDASKAWLASRGHFKAALDGLSEALAAFGQARVAAGGDALARARQRLAEAGAENGGARDGALAAAGDVRAAAWSANRAYHAAKPEGDQAALAKLNDDARALAEALGIRMHDMREDVPSDTPDPTMAPENQPKTGALPRLLDLAELFEDVRRGTGAFDASSPELEKRLASYRERLEDLRRASTESK